MLVGPDGVPDSLCERCYCVNHPPIAPPLRAAHCPHLGRRVRNDQGVIITRHCGPCGGRDLHVFTCDHPATADQVTLADCQVCRYGPHNPPPPGLAAAFDRVYLINLATRVDRLTAFRRRQEVQDWPLAAPILFPAIAGDVVGVPSYFSQGGGAWGCLRSHISILERCLMDGVDSVLVLEDDVEWMSDTWRRLEVFLSAAPPDWSQLMLGGQHIQPPMPIRDGVVRVTNCQRTHAYALRGPAIRSLLRTWYTSSVHCDWVMGNDWQRGWPVYAPDPFLFGQSGGKSDISGRLQNASYWNPPTNAPVVVLTAPPGVARQLRTHGFHMGFRRGADGYDYGLSRIVGAGLVVDQLRDWLATLLWEVASMEGRVTCVWHPAVSADLVRQVHGGPVLAVAGETAADCLAHVAGLQLRRCYSTSHVLILRAPREVAEGVAGFHRGYWIDPATGEDLGLRGILGSDPVARLQKWMSHVGEEAERIGAVPMIWHPDLSQSQVASAFPDREVVELTAASPADLYHLWSAYVSK